VYQPLHVNDLFSVAFVGMVFRQSYLKESRSPCKTAAKKIQRNPEEKGVVEEQRTEVQASFKVFSLSRRF
jgi:hypothetical protein